jgi:hypothetical protein
MEIEGAKILRNRVLFTLQIKYPFILRFYNRENTTAMTMRCLAASNLRPPNKKFR